MDNKDLAQLFSELVDGELTSDEANRVLLGALGSSEHRTELTRLLELRQGLMPWRALGGGAPFERPPTLLLHRTRRWRLGAIGLAAALAVSLTAWLWHTAYSGDSRHDQGNSTALNAGLRPRISDQEAARVLAVHESIAGPVAWLAISSDGVRLQSATSTSDRTPAIACFLNIAAGHSDAIPQPPEVVICRPEEKAVLRIPAKGRPGRTMSIELAATCRDNVLGIQYAIGIEDRVSSEPMTTSMTGFVPVTDSRPTIRPLALRDAIVDVGLSAAVIPQQVSA